MNIPPNSQKSHSANTGFKRLQIKEATESSEISDNFLENFPIVYAEGFTPPTIKYVSKSTEDTSNDLLKNFPIVFAKGFIPPTNPKIFKPTGNNTFKLSNGETYTYNDLSFNKTTVPSLAPLELEMGWWVDRTKLTTVEESEDKYKLTIAKWEEDRQDKPNSPKPSRDKHSFVQTDTEFNFQKLPLELQKITDLICQEARTHHTTQFKFLPRKGETAPNIIFASKKFAKEFNPVLEAKGYQPLPVLSETDCDLLDYLNLVTPNTWKITQYNPSESYLDSLPKYTYTLCAHNADAELNLIFHGQLKKRVKQLQTKFVSDEGIVQQGKVLKAFSIIIDVFGKKKNVDWVSLKCVISIDGIPHHFCLRIIDTIKVHGIVRLKNFGDASGYDLNEKDLLNSEDKSDIFTTALQRPEDFIAYALGDTCNGEIMYSFDEKLESIYAELGFSNYQRPNLTIGATVSGLDFAAIAEYLDMKSDGEGGTTWKEKVTEFVEREMQPYSPQNTVKNSTHSSSILAKGFGGRIGQNQPTEVSIQRKFKMDLRKRTEYGIELKNPLTAKFKTRKIKGKFDASIVVDIDISSCYAEAQRVQVLPIGRPIVGGLRLDTISKNDYPILGEFLTSCRVAVDKLCNGKWSDYNSYKTDWDNLYGELDYGTFNIFVECPKLENPIDILPSWLHPGKEVNHKMLAKLLADAVKGDEKAVEKIKQGHTKKLLNQLELSPITFDTLEWIFFSATPELRKELLTKARVVAFVIYPKSFRITSEAKNIKNRFQECQAKLDEHRNNWKPKNNLDFVVNLEKNFILYGENYRDCHYWYGETIGDLLLNKILSKRKVAQWIKKKCPLDLLYKLFNNTHFGVSISPLFSISNIVVGNNITARARVLAWCMEKTLLGFPTITDGDFFKLNRTLQPYNRPINSACINMDSPNSPLGLSNFGTQVLPYSLTFEDFKYTYSASTIEYVMKRKRIYNICTVIQTSKKDGTTQTFEAMYPLDRIVKWDNKQAVKLRINDVLAEQAKKHIQNCFPLITVVNMQSTEIKVRELDEKFRALESDERKADMVEVYEKPRLGLADLEIKDYYHEAGNHGMANYILATESLEIAGFNTKFWSSEQFKYLEKQVDKYCKTNGFQWMKSDIKPNEKGINFDEIVKLDNGDIDFKVCGIPQLTIKYELAFRGYESKKVHIAVIEENKKFKIIDRYLKQNPAKDLMLALLKNPDNVPRQCTAVKLKSVSIGDYRINSPKFNERGLEPGDQMKIPFLFTEFSVSQFTYQNKEQYFGWLDDVQKSKDKYGQSLEAWFINEDGNLRFQDLVLWSADAIERRIKSPIKELLSYGKRSNPKIGNPTKALPESMRFHPEFETYQKLKLEINSLDEIDESEIESDEQFELEE